MAMISTTFEGKCPHCKAAVAGVSRARDNWMMTCGACAQPFNTNEIEKPLRLIDPNRRFSGEEAISVTHGFHPREVPTARRLFPGNVFTGTYIHDNGDVEFSDRKAETQFKEAYKNVIHLMQKGFVPTIAGERVGQSGDTDVQHQQQRGGGEGDEGGSSTDEPG